MVSPPVGYIRLTLEVFREGKSYVSRCRELGVASCGDSVEEALEAVKEATTEYLNAIETLGERHRIFTEKGIVIHRSRPRVPETQAPVAPAELTKTVVLPVPRAA
jgi:predicted RNase H-like HicB family nuclease